MRKLVVSASALAFLLALATPGIALAKKSDSNGKSNTVKLAKASKKIATKSSDKSSSKSSVRNGPSAAVPEPSAALAFAAGLGALAMTRRRRSG